MLKTMLKINTGRLLIFVNAARYSWCGAQIVEKVSYKLAQNITVTSLAHGNLHIIIQNHESTSHSETQFVDTVLLRIKKRSSFRRIRIAKKYFSKFNSCSLVDKQTVRFWSWAGAPMGARALLPTCSNMHTAHETSHGWSTSQYAALSVAQSVSRALL